MNEPNQEQYQTWLNMRAKYELSEAETELAYGYRRYKKNPKPRDAKYNTDEARKAFNRYKKSRRIRTFEKYLEFNEFVLKNYHQRRAIIKDKDHPDSDFMKVKQRVNQIKTRAKKRNLAFDLTVDFLLTMLAETPTCPVFGTELGDNWEVDRTDPSKGYTQDNVRILSREANRLKDNGTLDQFKAIVRYLESM